MKKLSILIIVLVIGAIAYTLCTSHLHIERTKIGDTSTQIAEIKKLGQWQFLTAEVEVLVDTVRKRSILIPDDRLARIYRGTMRIGIDLDRTDDSWVTVSGDTAATVMLPMPRLLDDNFIDEANTVAFYQEGVWDAAAKEQMYRRARSRMLAIGLSEQNMATARENARARFASLFRAMGFKHVNVIFSDE